MHDETTSRRVPIERPRDIPVSRARLLGTLSERIESAPDKEQFAGFCGRLEQRLHVDYLPQLKILKHDFELFSESSGGGQLRRMTQEEIEQAEERFLRGFLDTMRQAGYRLLSQSDVDVARQESYLLGLPLSVNWKALDGDMLGRYWQHNEYAASGEPPEFAERLLVFHRGVGVDRTSSVHFWPKLKVLVKRAFSTSYRRARDKLTQLGTKRIVPPPSESKAPSAYSPPPDDPASAASASTGDVVQSDAQAAASPPSLRAAMQEKVGTEPASCPEIPAKEESGPQERFIERIALKDLPLGIASLWRQTLIQEPTYQELVILYRKATPAEVRERVTDKDRTIQVKAFRDVPMADLEAVYADAGVVDGESPFPRREARLCIGAGVIILLLTCCAAFDGALGLLVALLLVLVSLYVGLDCVDLVVTIKRWRQLLQKLRVDNPRNDGLGAMLALIDQLEDREFKSAMLAYHFVWRQSVSSADELKQKCEVLLEQEYGVEVDFAAAAAVKTLSERGLLTRDDERLSAVPPEEAVRRLAAFGERGASAP